GSYVTMEADWKTKTNAFLGDLPEDMDSWKSLSRDPERSAKLEAHFNKLFAQNTRGSELAKAYLLRSKAIGEKLVSDGVANNADDVNGVLMNGFFHIYGPVNSFA
ncbi:MAG: 3-hydroxyacyl-CoA dehydrogenase family protein, partial [Calditrichota bacterium]